MSAFVLHDDLVLVDEQVDPGDEPAGVVEDHRLRRDVGQSRVLQPDPDQALWWGLGSAIEPLRGPAGAEHPAPSYRPVDDRRQLLDAAVSVVERRVSQGDQRRFPQRDGQVDERACR